VQVLQYVELNPQAADQLLTSSQHSQLLSDAAAAWTYFSKKTLAGQQPLPATSLVPWHAFAVTVGCDQPQEQQQQHSPIQQQTAAAEPTVLIEQPLPPPLQQQQQQG
jgi:hypothetical protein